MPLMETLYAMERAKQVSMLPFFYSASFTGNAVAAGVTVPAITAIQSDSHFVCRYFTMTVYQSNPFVVSTVTPPLLISFFDTGSGRTILDSNQPIQNLVGGNPNNGGIASLPYILPEPWLLRAASTIQTTIQNLGVLTYPTLIISFSGLKVFKFGGGLPDLNM